MRSSGGRVCASVVPAVALAMTASPWVGLGVGAAAAADGPVVPAGKNHRLSTSSGGIQGNDHSAPETGHNGMSADGRWVVFTSNASNLTPHDTNGARDVFLRDRRTGTTKRESWTSREAQANIGTGDTAVVSDDGRFVAFTSESTNLAPHETNNWPDVFLRDRKRGVTGRVSLNSQEAPADNESELSAISAGGRFVLFTSPASNLAAHDTNHSSDVFLRDRMTGTTHLVSEGRDGAAGDAASTAVALSPQARYVVFESTASNLVPGDTNHTSDFFILDRRTGTTRRVSVDSHGRQGVATSSADVPFGAISAGGRYVVFSTDHSGLVDGDTNGDFDVFVRYLRNGTTQLVSVGGDGARGDADSFGTGISADGRYVVFETRATSLLSGQDSAGQVLVRDRSARDTWPVSVSPHLALGNQASGGALLSADGHRVVFDSTSTNIVVHDVNEVPDVFSRDLHLG
jgi:Tol biopolymer transport system component